MIKINTKNRKGRKATQAFSSFIHRIGRDANLDWALSVGFAFILALALVGVAYTTFVRTSHLNVTALTAPVAPKKAIFSRSDLQNVLQAYDDRVVQSAQLQKGYAGPADPSI